MQVRPKQRVAKTEILTFINSPYAESGELPASFLLFSSEHNRMSTAVGNYFVLATAVDVVYQF
jgi:hypothetical protein